ANGLPRPTGPQLWPSGSGAEAAGAPAPQRTVGATPLGRGGAAASARPHEALCSRGHSPGGDAGHPEGGRRRVRVTADRGCAAVALLPLLSDLGVALVIRVKKSTKLCIASVWRRLDTRRFAGHTRRRTLGRRLSCAHPPHRC